MEALSRIMGRVDDLHQRQWEALEERVHASIAAHGGLEPALRAGFPHLPWDDVAVANLDSAAAVAAWWDWDKANQRLSVCRYCSGQLYGHDGYPEPGYCEAPTMGRDGTISWAFCRKQAAAIERARIRKLLGESLLPKRFQRRQLDDFDASGDPSLGEALTAARRFAAEFGAQEQQGLLLMGPAGTGKTHLAAGLLQVVLAKGYAARYHTVPDLLAELRSAIDDKRLEQVMQGLREVPLLVVDDLGKEYIPGAAVAGYTSVAWAQQELYRIINRRYEDDRPVVITTNLDEQGLLDRYGPALVSRLHEMCRWHVLDVPDYRRRSTPPNQTQPRGDGS